MVSFGGDKKHYIYGGSIALLAVCILTAGLVIGLVPANSAANSRARTFEVDYTNNQFLLDGAPFQYVSGSFHYFRALPQTWRTHLRTMRAAGLNVVDTYVEWALHNPKEGEYTFEGIADLVSFIKIAQEEDLLVILRPGPYICAERDNGGVPYWLARKYPDIKIRTSDADYKKEVSNWYSMMMPRIMELLYANGGPIIMVQVENEYGVYGACDTDYMEWLKNETELYVKEAAVLFTVDIPNSAAEMRCGTAPGVLATTDFGIDRAHEMDAIWAMLREIQPTGPLVNSEFYPGWLTHWQEANQRRSADEVADALKKMLAAGASVNFYMFFGGTNFGFTAGANDWGMGKYQADLTSYDYDAVMDEAGDPNGVKYIKVRNVISEYIALSTVPVPDKQPKMTLASIVLKPVEYLLSDAARADLGSMPLVDGTPHSFEQLDQFSGLVLYEAPLPELQIDPTELQVADLRDRALVYVDQLFVGVLSRENVVNSLPISKGLGSKLQILVENQGRINFNTLNDTKGLGGAKLKTYSGEFIDLTESWMMTGFPLTDYTKFDTLLAKVKNNVVDIHKKGILYDGPVIFYGEFTIDAATTIYDTYLDPTGWGKGVLYINGFNLGRYWPLVGPQVTMFIPKDLLVHGPNTIVLLEYQKCPTDMTATFTDTPQLDKVNTAAVVVSKNTEL